MDWFAVTVVYLVVVMVCILVCLRQTEFAGLFLQDQNAEI